MRKRLGFVAAVGGLVFGLWLDEPADRVVTETIIEQVEVPGEDVVRYVTPALPDSCKELGELQVEMYDLYFEYSTAVTPQADNLNEAVQAIHSGDYGRINEVISTQNDVQLALAGPLREITNLQDRLAGMTTQCEDDLEVLE